MDKKEKILFSIVMSMLMVLAGLVGYIIGTLEGDDDPVIPPPPPPPENVFDTVIFDCKSYYVNYSPCDISNPARVVYVPITVYADENEHPLFTNLSQFRVVFEVFNTEGLSDVLSTARFKVHHSPELRSLYSGEPITFGEIKFWPNSLHLYLGEKKYVEAIVDLTPTKYANTIAHKEIYWGYSLEWVIDIAGDDYTIMVIIDRIVEYEP